MSKLEGIGAERVPMALRSSECQWQYLYFFPLPHQHGSLRPRLRSAGGVEREKRFLIALSRVMTSSPEMGGTATDAAVCGVRLAGRGRCVKGEEGCVPDRYSTRAAEGVRSRGAGTPHPRGTITTVAATRWRRASAVVPWMMSATPRWPWAPSNKTSASTSVTRRDSSRTGSPRPRRQLAS